MLIVGAGVAAGFYGVSRIIRGKQINTLPYGHGIKMKKAVTIKCTPESLYTYWRNLSNLPALFDNVLAVHVLLSAAVVQTALRVYLTVIAGM